MMFLHPIKIFCTNPDMCESVHVCENVCESMYVCLCVYMKVCVCVYVKVRVVGRTTTH